MKGLIIHEEHEDGDGYSDIVLEDFDEQTVCILELRRTRDPDACCKAADDAACQIVTRGYAGDYGLRHYKYIYGLGIGLAKKSCVIKSLGNLAAKDSD